MMGVDRGLTATQARQPSDGLQELLIDHADPLHPTSMNEHQPTVKIP
jgi:hypothetical protein